MCAPGNMKSRVIIFGLLLFYLLVAAAINPFNVQANTVDEASRGFTANTSVSDNRTWSCPDNWIPYESGSEISCLWMETTARDYHAAQTHCRSIGGQLVIFDSQDKEAFIKSLAKAAESSEYWIGLSKERGYDEVFQWETPEGKIVANTEILPQQIKDYLSYKAQCVYITASNDDLEMDDCEPEYLSMCEMGISCDPGSFGNMCEKECHCMGEPCDPHAANRPGGVTCKWGCQRGWMGVACDTKKEDPDVKYFCINLEDKNVKYAQIHIYTKGVHYRAIYGLTANKARGDWCNFTNANFYESAMVNVIKIPITEASIEEMASGKCVGKQLKENIFSWEIVVKENDGILLENDLLINITCDFSTADNLVRSDKYSFNGELRHVNHQTIVPESIQDDVTLQIIDAYSGEPVKEASIGSTVVLQMKYGQRKGSLLTNVFPYNCRASSSDGKHVKQLLDEFGCKAENSPVDPFTLGEDKKIVTPWFRLFGFEDEQTVNFQCSFKLCFASNCKTGCWHYYRDKRDAENETDDEQHSITRKIRVLPSIPAQKPAGDNQRPEYQADKPLTHAGYDIGPFVYLNPVTCTLFLLILLIFMCMYIAFLRTLRKSVYDIRKEIEVKRSRDKFLHCGCVQQKDRDYIVPQIQ